MIRLQLKCKKCHHSAFGFVWKFKTKKEVSDASLMHDGFGLQLSDAVIRCLSCGENSEYENEEFLEVVEV